MGRLRVAFVSQPWAQALPPSESAAIWTREVARRLANRADVVVYGRGSERGVRVESDEGVEYRLLPAELDWRLMKAATPLRIRRPARRPFFSGYLFSSDPVTSPIGAPLRSSVEPEGDPRPAPGATCLQRTCPCGARRGSRLSLACAVAVAQLVEPRVVVPVVAGSSPVRHPMCPR